MSDVVLADLRRLYHHSFHGGMWNSKIDTRRLGKAIEVIERLTDELAMEEECYEELSADNEMLRDELEDQYARLEASYEWLDEKDERIAKLEAVYEELSADRDEWEGLWKKASMSVIGLQDRVKELEGVVDAVMAYDSNLIDTLTGTATESDGH
jgi:chromosome segregation ATPase